MSQPKTDGYTPADMKICGTCRFLISQGAAKCGCQHSKNFPMSDGIPDVSVFDLCNDWETRND